MCQRNHHRGRGTDPRRVCTTPHHCRSESLRMAASMAVPTASTLAPALCVRIAPTPRCLWARRRSRVSNASGLQKFLPARNAERHCWRLVSRREGRVGHLKPGHPRNRQSLLAPLLRPQCRVDVLSGRWEGGPCGCVAALPLHELHSRMSLPLPVSLASDQLGLHKNPPNLGRLLCCTATHARLNPAQGRPQCLTGSLQH
mmetsp:Transcript_53780/g.143967  ORF Transcript_53780/g.143967 Transcript_53780/m.143967 type:complete len:200 (+) Transcript_53780:1261-1860(+)